MKDILYIFNKKSYYTYIGKFYNSLFSWLCNLVIPPSLIRNPRRIMARLNMSLSLFIQSQNDKKVV